MNQRQHTHITIAYTKIGTCEQIQAFLFRKTMLRQQEESLATQHADSVTSHSCYANCIYSRTEFRCCYIQMTHVDIHLHVCVRNCGGTKLIGLSRWPEYRGRKPAQVKVSVCPLSYISRLIKEPLKPRKIFRKLNCRILEPKNKLQK